jgi:hypothetical protein
LRKGKNSQKNKTENDLLALYGPDAGLDWQFKTIG